MAASNIPLNPAAVVRPVSARPAEHHWFMIMLSVLVAVASIAGIVWSVMHGHNDWAIAVGIVGSAFFARSAC